MRIEGRPTEDSESAQPGGGLCSLAAVVSEVLAVGYLPPPGKSKENISDIRYPCGFEYVRVVVRYAVVVGPSWVEPSFSKTFTTRYRPPFGVLIFLRLMLFLFPRWSASVRQPLRTAFTSSYTL